jgi:CheY-like chemotaxis protein
MFENESSEVRMAVVLVVEDDDDLREVVVSTLERVGYRVLGARDGHDALTLLEREPDVALILLDLLMPRMSGWEFRRQQLADARLAKIPLVVMSATQTLEEAAVSADGLLRKPLSFTSLVKTVERYARGGPPRSRPDGPLCEGP